jgi:hypothetical protein
VNVLRVIAVAFLVTGAGFTSCASRIYDERRAFFERARPAAALVLEVTRHTGTGRRAGSWSAYQLEFKTAGGDVVRAKADDTDSLAEYQQGQAVPVVYAPGDPTRVAIDTFNHRWSRVGLPGTLGAGFLLQGLLPLWLTAARPRSRATSAAGRDLWRAFREGRLRRDAEYQPLLIALSFLGVAFTVVAVLVALFSGTNVKILFAMLFLCCVFMAWRGSRKRPGAPR